MITLKTLVSILDLKKVGACPACMRISFVLMAISWLSLFLSFEYSLEPKLAFLVLASGLTVLWLIHVIRRIMIVIKTHPEHYPINKERRTAIGNITKVALGAVLLSALPQRVFASSGCGGWAGNSGCGTPPASIGVFPIGCYRQENNCNWTGPCNSCGSNCSSNAC
jgi:membrane-bound metal-dependent hydrolase YbcI (DUF457 family)